MGKYLVKAGIITALSVGHLFGAVGQSSFEFMLIGAGSRASGMGEAYTAVSGDVGAQFFNPASLGMMQGREVSFAHIAYIEDVTLEQFAFRSISGDFRFGGSMNVGKVADIERRGQTPTGDPLGLFDEHNFVASFYWGMPVADKISIGNTVKFAYEKIDLEDASAFAIDLGGFYALTPNIALGASIRNLGTKPKFVDTAFDLPREIRLGASYRTGESFPGITVAADFIKPEWGDKSSKFNVGGEYNYQNLAFLRAGGNIGYDSRSISVGAGIAYRDYLFDYAFVPMKNDLGNTHRFTLSIRL
ncbi:MAG: PorV/PorQ family protein [candidate division Zixibacteria bacterium]